MSFERVTHSKSVENLSGKIGQKEARRIGTKLEPNIAVESSSDCILMETSK